jgi:hypothetical protein
MHRKCHSGTGAEDRCQSPAVNRISAVLSVVRCFNVSPVAAQNGKINVYVLICYFQQLMVCTLPIIYNKIHFTDQTVTTTALLSHDPAAP